MIKFALVFDFPEFDRQILVMKGENEDDQPCIKLITHIDDGAELSLGLNFSNPDEDKALDGRDKVFDDIEKMKSAARGFAEKLSGCRYGADAVGSLSE